MTGPGAPPDGAPGPLFTRWQWFALPLKLRQRYWAESDYGDHAPSAALLMDIALTLTRLGVPLT